LTSQDKELRKSISELIDTVINENIDNFTFSYTKLIDSPVAVEELRQMSKDKLLDLMSNRECQYNWGGERGVIYYYATPKDGFYVIPDIINWNLYCLGVKTHLFRGMNN
jgi:hypothetical protein